jgi:hypothetical protein
MSQTGRRDPLFSQWNPFYPRNADCGADIRTGRVEGGGESQVRPPCGHVGRADLVCLLHIPEGGGEGWDAYWVGDLTAILREGQCLLSYSSFFFVFTRRRARRCHIISHLRVLIFRNEWNGNGNGKVLCQDTEFVQYARLLSQTKYMTPLKWW